MDERKLKILLAIVDQYIITGEPVGSKAVVNLLDINISTATIRNEMAALENLGYLEQPHTSAGRIPSYNGYRLYVDHLMGNHTIPDEEKAIIDNLLKNDATTVEGIVQNASLALAEITKCATVVANSSPKFSVISKVEVIPTGKRLYVILIVTSEGNVKNKVCRLEFDLTHDQLSFFESFVKDNLEGMCVNNLSDEMIEKLSTAMGAYMITLSPLINGLVEMSKEFLNNKVIIEGETNLLACKDFNKDEIIQFLNNKNEYTQMLDESLSGLHVMFSKENNDFIISNSSIITSPFSKGGQKAGALGIIGPMRINYAKVIPYLEYITGKITDLLSNDKDEQN